MPAPLCKQQVAIPSNRHAAVLTLGRLWQIAFGAETDDQLDEIIFKKAIERV
ncbi:hypothetical protein [Halorhodospira halochloris]|uniref:hypothetical protein n=1 Tax=Halorhodospira halochloris TaxID=1052 RepID=UPI00076F7BE9|nr:hypothetical protein [Halorhodospira halochloris]